MNTEIKDTISESIRIKLMVLEDLEIISNIQQVIDVVVDAFRQDRKVLFCGNGGSAADAQHLAAEFTGRFYLNRSPLYAEALHVNTSYLTAVANDYSFDEVYARMVKAIGRPGDILFAMSTSGNSPNILRAIEQASEINMIVVGMTGESGGLMFNKCTYDFNIPSTVTPRIQECHMLIGHIICEQVEKALFG